MLIKCKECGREIARTITKCPGCGTITPTGYIAMFIASFLCLGAIITGIILGLFATR